MTFLKSETRITSTIALLNSQKLVVGDVVSFENLVSDQDFVSGIWRVEPSDAMEIDEKSGWATATKPGPMRISYFVNEVQRTSIDLEAIPASRILFGPESADATISRQFEKPQIVSFAVRSENGNESSNFHGQTRAVQSALEKSNGGGPFVESSLFSCSANFAQLSGAKQ